MAQLDNIIKCVKNRKNWVPASFDEGFWQTSKRQVLGNNFGCVWWLLLIVNFQPDESIHRGVRLHHMVLPPSDKTAQKYVQGRRDSLVHLVSN